jgi:hypothetical protein
VTEELEGLGARVYPVGHRTMTCVSVSGMRLTGCLGLTRKEDHHDVGNNPAEEVQMARRERRKFTDEYAAAHAAPFRHLGAM